MCIHNKYSQSTVYMYIVWVFIISTVSVLCTCILYGYRNKYSQSTVYMYIVWVFIISTVSVLCTCILYGYS